MNSKSIIFLSCGIFKEELQYLIKEKRLDWNVVFLDAALHVNFDRLKEQLLRNLDESLREGREIKVIYGHCHPQIVEILEQYGATRMQAGNCLEAMVGQEEIARLNAEAITFFLTSGWINHWEEMFHQVKDDFNFAVKDMFEHYQRIIVFETDVIPINEEKLLKFSTFTGLPVERRKIALDHFLNLVKGIQR
jgi:hypothetical protein